VLLISSFLMGMSAINWGSFFIEDDRIRGIWESQSDCAALV